MSMEWERCFWCVGCEPSRWLSAGCICWVVPFPSNSYKQDYGGSLSLSPSFASMAGEGDQQKYAMSQQEIHPWDLQLELFEHQRFGHTNTYLSLLWKASKKQVHKKPGSSCDKCQSTWIHLYLVYFLCIYIIIYIFLRFVYVLIPFEIWSNRIPPLFIFQFVFNFLTSSTSFWCILTSNISHVPDPWDEGYVYLHGYLIFIGKIM